MSRCPTTSPPTVPRQPLWRQARRAARLHRLRRKHSEPTSGSTNMRILMLALPVSPSPHSLRLRSGPLDRTPRAQSSSRRSRVATGSSSSSTGRISGRKRARSWRRRPNSSEDGATRISLVGNADRAGSPAYNEELSRRRADAVRAELERLGVPGSVIMVTAEGENAPIVPTADGVREPRNRYRRHRLPRARGRTASATAPARRSAISAAKASRTA